MSRPPKISVLIPTYNYARYLPAAIESVLIQDFTDYELIISDDASTDGSADIIRQYAAANPRIRCQIHPVNLGMVANWNWCLHEARGEYIKYLFGDDRLASPQTLRKMSAMLDDNPGAVMAVSARSIIDENSLVIETWDDLKTEGVHPGWDVGHRCLLLTNNFIGEPSVALFRAAGAGGRGFDPRYRQIVDLEMWCRLLKSGDLIYTKEQLCMFRCHAQQQTEANRTQNLGKKEYVLLFNDYFDYYVPASIPIPARERKYLFDCIFYTRKGKSDAMETELVEQKLMPKLGRGWYAVYWLMHRMVRPFTNLKRAWRKYVLGTLDEKGRPRPAVAQTTPQPKN